MIYKITKILNYIFHIIKRSFYYKKNISKLKRTFKEKRIILFCTPEHGNLGDHAIAIAQDKFFKDNFPKINIIEITSHFYLKKKEVIKKLINETDILVISGGGFIGSLWLNEEYLVRDIISNFLENKIIIFPQTIFFEKSNFGKNEFKNSKKIYSNNKNLYICVRDKKSLIQANKLISNKKNIFYIPDIVLYLTDTIIQKNFIRNNNILICLRKDKEKVKNKELQKILLILKKEYKLKYTDTVVNTFILPKNRKKYVNKKILEFSKVKLVITDRLHGMIFSFLTRTPCIALNNSSGKVLGVYNWIKNCNYIKVIKKPEDIPNLIKILVSSDTKKIDLKNNWNELKKIF